MKIFRKLYYNIKYFIQRGKRGYSDFDIMDFDTYLLELIPNALKDFNNKRDTYPSELSDEEWGSVLNEIITSFENANDIAVVSISADEENQKMNKIKEKKEYLQKNLEKGFELLLKYFHDLWY